MSIKGNEYRKEMDRVINWFIDNHGHKPMQIHMSAKAYDYLLLTEMHGHFDGTYRDVKVIRVDIK